MLTGQFFEEILRAQFSFKLDINLRSSMKAFFVLLVVLCSTWGFHKRMATRLVPALKSAAQAAVQVHGLDLTDSLRQRVDGKVNKVLSKLGSRRLVNAHVLLKLDGQRDATKGAHNAHEGQTCEIVCSMKGGETIKATQSSDDMYKSIDLAAHSLAQNLKKHVKKIKDHKGGEHRTPVGGHGEDEDFDALIAWNENELLQ